MTPKQKAEELVGKYYLENITWALKTAKKFAIISVNEILDVITDTNKNISELEKYWIDVKEEIAKL